MKQMPISLECVVCSAKYPWDVNDYRCTCPQRGLLEVRHGRVFNKADRDAMTARSSESAGMHASGVWRFHEAVLPLPADFVVTHPEGHTRIYRRESLSQWSGVDDLSFKHEGENPTGSFKDRGMTVAVSVAKARSAKTIACASTGNTSAALAAYAAQAGIPSVVFLPAGKIAMGKLSQAIAYGAQCLAVRGDFDAAMNLVEQSAHELGFYLVNSLNPYRLEGQKTIIWEMLAQRQWNVPNWIVVPAGNLGNTSAFGKALQEALAWGWIDKLPRIVSVQAAGANPFVLSFQKQFRTFESVRAETIATAIRIGNPVNYLKAVRVIEQTNGLVMQVSDEEILAAKQQIDRSGLGCEPASACTLAGIKTLRAQGVICARESVVAVLTGNVLKDSEVIFSHPQSTSQLVCEIDPNLDAVRAATLN
ncbi:MAG: threonine synthase [Pseudomonadota bacterium]